MPPTVVNILKTEGSSGNDWTLRIHWGVLQFVNLLHTKALLEIVLGKQYLASGHDEWFHSCEGIPWLGRCPTHNSQPDEVPTFQVFDSSDACEENLHARALSLQPLQVSHMLQWTVNANNQNSFYDKIWFLRYGMYIISATNWTHNQSNRENNISQWAYRLESQQLHDKNNFPASQLHKLWIKIHSYS